MALNQEQVLAALRNVKDPELYKDLVTLNRVKRVQVEGTRVHVTIETPNQPQPLRDIIERDVKLVLLDIGATDIHVEMSTGSKVAAGPANQVLPQVKNVIAVGAGKGGVGKSTLAVNIAVGLSRTGAKVGLMDGDIYGPSMPTMLGIKGQSPQVRGSKIVPFHVHGIHAITIGALVEQDKPLIWRGPMAHGAFKQLFCDNTDWPELDYLVVDLPPGTGDVPLTLCQLLPLTGAVVVATPQQVALDDAVRAVKMFQQLNTPILGIVENMSYMPLPDGTIADIFGRGGAEKAAQNLQLPFLGALPMYQQLRINSDAGTPISNFEPKTELADALKLIIHNLVNEIQLAHFRVKMPALNVV